MDFGSDNPFASVVTGAPFKRSANLTIFPPRGMHYVSHHLYFDSLNRLARSRMAKKTRDAFAQLT